MTRDRFATEEQWELRVSKPNVDYLITIFFDEEEAQAKADVLNAVCGESVYRIVHKNAA